MIEITLKVGEKLKILKDVSVTVWSIDKSTQPWRYKNGCVTLAFDAPKSVRIDREEVLDKRGNK